GREAVDVERVRDRERQQDDERNESPDPLRNATPLGPNEVEPGCFRRAARLPARVFPHAAAAGAHHAPSGVRSPSRPSGRKTRIAIRIAKTIERVQSLPGANHESPSLKAWISPMMIAPSTAPVRFPIPPSTAAVKAIRPRVKPVS